MRERRINKILRFRLPGITPAYAGKTPANRHSSKNMWDHPRVCGKDSTQFVIGILSIGSPPRMRERPVTERVFPPSERITPAYAGKTHLNLGHYRIPRDHPRVCGKDMRLLARILCARGSPPRMRERRWFATCNLSVYGITPAYAGKTLALSRCLAGSRDHPRVCGKDQSRPLNP